MKAFLQSKRKNINKIEILNRDDDPSKAKRSNLRFLKVLIIIIINSKKNTIYTINILSLGLNAITTNFVL